MSLFDDSRRITEGGQHVTCDQPGRELFAKLHALYTLPTAVGRVLPDAGAAPLPARADSLGDAKLGASHDDGMEREGDRLKRDHLEFNQNQIQKPYNFLFCRV